MRISRQSIGLLGVALLGIGVFSPIVSLPFVGRVNYFANGHGDGTFILVFAAIAAALLLVKKAKLVIIPAGFSLALIGYTFVNLAAAISDMKASIDTELAGNPFRGFADMAVQSVHLQWGLAVMLAGIALLGVAALRKEDGLVVLSTPMISPAPLIGSGSAE